jgi:hypothetical protein
MRTMLEIIFTRASTSSTCGYCVVALVGKLDIIVSRDKMFVFFIFFSI